MRPHDRSGWIDFAFVAALLGAMAVTLLAFRGSKLLEEPAILIGLTLGLPAGIAILWRASASLSRRQSEQSLNDSGGINSPTRSATEVVVLMVLLAVLTYFTFTVPLRIHFWGGGDEHISLSEIQPIRSLLVCDATLNRPFTMLPVLVGQRLAPDRIEGFLWLATGLCWANGLFLFLILREALPRARLLRAGAAVLLIVDRSDPARFYVMWASNFYWTALAFTLASAWLFLRSYRIGSRPLLVLACIMLVIAALTNEGAYPLAALTLAVAWLMPASRHRLPVWGFAWIGMLSLLALRFILFLTEHSGDAYQTAQVAGAMRSPGMLLDNLRLHLATTLSYFEMHGGLRRHWHWALPAGAIAVAIIFFMSSARRACRFRDAERGIDVGTLAMGFIAMLCGSAPFLHMNYAFRAEFFAAPGKAVLLASGLCLIGSRLGRHRVAFVTIVVGFLAANATGEATRTQVAKRASSPIHFEAVTHVFQQIHAFSPTMAPDTIVLLFLDDPKRSPLGVSYAVLMLGKEILGVPVLQVNYDERTLLPIKPVFGRNSIALPEGRSKRLWPSTATYDQLLAFRVAPDGTVRPMRTLPEAVGYDPLARVVPGPIDELPYLRYPSWAKRPRDLFEMNDGMLLDEGWGDLEASKAGRFRAVHDEATIAVNPMGQTRRSIVLDVEPEAADCIEAVDAFGQVIASAPLHGRTTIQLDVPTDPQRIQWIHLRAVGESTAFRAYCPRSR